MRESALPEPGRTHYVATHNDRQKEYPPLQRSHLIAAGITVFLIAYFAINTGLRKAAKDDTTEAVAESAVPEAVVQAASAVMHNVNIRAKGRTAPDKIVTVSAGTMGTVVSTPAQEGSFVRRGTLLCGLDVEARSARVKEAEAMRETARIDYEAARTLASKGLAPANQEAAALARVNAADAGVNAAKIEIGKTQIRAPFEGIFETRLAEAGDFLGMGEACGVLVDLSPVIVTAEVSEAEAGKLQPGLVGQARLIDGRTFPAKLRFVARTANTQTRTYLVEAELDTGKDVVAAGVSAQLMLPAGEVQATLISPALLTLADNGDVGVRYVEADSTVQFARVTVVEEVPGGAWVMGLPDRANIISMGQDYLAEGVTVTPVFATGAR